MAAPAAAHKLQLLADALAVQFAQSEASTACASALARLLPGLEYLSIAVSNPAQGGGIVESANCAVEGPTTLHLHDPLYSAAGRALAHGKPLQVSLDDGSAAAVVAAWTDVQVMAAHAPAVSHLLCVPFGCGAGGGGAGGHGGAHQAAAGSGSGALLFGFASPPALEPRRKAMLAALAACLPAPMSRLSAETLAFVNFACGSGQQCSCCCGAEEEEEADEAVVPSSPCREDGRGDGGDNGTGPSQALRVPGAPAAGDGDAPGPSTRWWEAEGGGKESLKAHTAAAGTAAAASLPRAAPAPASPRISKAIAAAAAAGGEELLAQSSLTLAFRSALVEGEYVRWVSQYHAKVDLLFSVLLLAALAIVSFVLPYRLVPASSLLGAGMALPLLAHVLARSRYAAWRERLAVVLRLYTVGFINLVSIASYQAQLSHHRLQHWTTFWMLTGSESLAVTALGFPVRLQLHLPLQFLSMAVASWNMPRMCHDCYPGTNVESCFKSSAAMAALCGYIAPSLALRFLEQRSRSLFSSRLRAAAMHLS